MIFKENYSLRIRRRALLPADGDDGGLLLLSSSFVSVTLKKKESNKD